MSAIRITRRIESDQLNLTDLTPLIGKDVLITIEEMPQFESLETEATMFGLAPPPPSPEQLERDLAALRERAKTDPHAAAWLELIETDALDVQRMIRNRGLQ
jgi:hypothetical protein